jgi:uncharacterized protein
VASLDDLLHVQELDTRLDQLRHRHETLAERSELQSVSESLRGSEASEQDCATRLRSVRSAQKEAEDHAALLDNKAAEVQASLYDGSVSAHKELESLQLEHRMLKEHQSEHEDRALELMEQAEPIESELAAARDAVLALRTRLEDVRVRLAEAEASIDGEIAGVTAERGSATDAVPAEILETYETLRRQLGGVAVARLMGARCEGCHLEIPSAQLEVVRRAPADALVTCPECFRILVR